MTRVDRGLAVRMIVSVVLLAVLTGVLFAVLYLLGAVAALVAFGTARAAFVGGLVAGVGGLALVGALEYRQLRAVRNWGGAEPVTSEEFPHLHALTARVATQLEIPTPTIALSESEVPEAMVVGWRPGRSRLILSYGTLGALDDAELEAVVAHELAHVRNRDSAVTTVLSLPAVLSEGIKTRCERYLESLEEPEGGDDAFEDGYEPPEELMPEPGDDDDDDSDLVERVVCHVLVAVSSVTLVCSHAVIALLSRERERRADRVAAEATGQPSTLADALRTLDRQIQARPDRDLREVTSASALSVLPLDPAVVDDVGLDRSGDGAGASVDAGESVGANAATGVAADVSGGVSANAPSGAGSGGSLSQRLFRTHPPTAERLQRLAEMERALEEGGA